MEHLRLMLAVLSSMRLRAEGAGEWQEDAGLGLYRGPEDAPPAGAHNAGRGGGPGVQQKVTALENIVCVLNREVERSALTLEALSRQHRLDQEKIENLSNKVLHTPCRKQWTKIVLQKHLVCWIYRIAFPFGQQRWF